MTTTTDDESHERQSSRVEHRRRERTLKSEQSSIGVARTGHARANESAALTDERTRSGERERASSDEREVNDVERSTNACATTRALEGGRNGRGRKIAARRGAGRRDARRAISLVDGVDERDVSVNSAGMSPNAHGDAMANAVDARGETTEKNGEGKNAATVIRVKSKSAATASAAASGARDGVRALVRDMGSMRVAKEAATQTTEEREEAYRAARERIFGFDGDGEGGEGGGIDAERRAETPRSGSPRLPEQTSSDATTTTERSKNKAVKKNRMADSFDPDFRRRAPPAQPPLPPGRPPMQMGMFVQPMPQFVPPHFVPGLHFVPQPMPAPPGMHFAPFMPMPMPMPQPIAHLPTAQFAVPHPNANWFVPPGMPMPPPHHSGDNPRLPPQ